MRQTPPVRSHSVLAFGFVFLMLGVCTIPAAAQAPPPCTQKCYLEINSPRSALMAGETPDNRVHTGNDSLKDRLNAKWNLTPVPGEPDYFYICESKFNLCMVAGDTHNDGNVYHQAPNNRENAKWRFELKKNDPTIGFDGYFVYNKKYPGFIIGTGANDGFLHMVDKSALTSMLSWWAQVIISGPPPPVALNLPAEAFVLRDLKYRMLLYAENLPPSEMVDAHHGALQPVDADNGPKKYVQFVFEPPDKIRLATSDMGGQWYLAGARYAVGYVGFTNANGIAPANGWRTRANVCPYGSVALIDPRNDLAVSAGATADGKVSERAFDGQASCWSVEKSPLPGSLASLGSGFLMQDLKHGQLLYGGTANYNGGQGFPIPALHGKPDAATIAVLKQGIREPRAVMDAGADWLGAAQASMTLTVGDPGDNRVYWMDFLDKRNVKWQMVTAGCPPNSFRLVDKRDGRTLSAGDNADGNIYALPFQGGKNQCWTKVTLADYTKYFNLALLHQYYRPGTLGPDGEGSGDEYAALAAGGPQRTFTVTGPGEGVGAESQCKFLGGDLPCAKWARRCLWAVNMTRNPVLVEGSRDVDDRGRASIAGWMLVPPNSRRAFQSIGAPRSAACIHCGNASQIGDWTSPEGASLKYTARWTLPTGNFYIGSWDMDNSGCPNPLQLE